MADWQMKIDVSDFWDKYPEELSLKEIAEKLVERLEQIKPSVEKRFPNFTEDLERVIELFEEFIRDDDLNSDVEEFDDRLSELYDWADSPLDDRLFGGRKLMWIKTFGGVK